MYRRLAQYSWLIFLGIGILSLIYAILHTLGKNTDSALVEHISGESIDELRTSTPKFFDLYNFYFSGGGLSDVGVGFFLIMISVFAYRKGHRWAWYSLWFVPVFFTVWIFLILALPKSAQSLLLGPLIGLIGVSLFGLMLPFRIFFPNKSSKLTL
jgi:hypothetical protein